MATKKPAKPTAPDVVKLTIRLPAELHARLAAAAAAEYSSLSNYIVRALVDRVVKRG